MAPVRTSVLLALVLLVAAQPARAVSLVNGSFEDDALAADSFCISFAAPLCASLTGWSGDVYLVNGSPGPIAPQLPIPDGEQFAMIQSTAVMQQSVTIDVAGSYRLTWSDAGRAHYIGANGNASYDVSFDGTVLGSYDTVTGSPWASHSLTFHANAGVFTLEIAGTTPASAGDNSVLLDAFVLVPEPSALCLDAAALAFLACRSAALRRRARRGGRGR